MEETLKSAQISKQLKKCQIATENNIQINIRSNINRDNRDYKRNIGLVMALLMVIVTVEVLIVSW